MLPVFYDDEVSEQQIGFIDNLLGPEFEDGDWQIVETETGNYHYFKLINN